MNLSKTIQALADELDKGGVPYEVVTVGDKQVLRVLSASPGVKPGESRMYTFTHRELDEERPSIVPDWAHGE